MFMGLLGLWNLYTVAGESFQILVSEPFFVDNLDKSKSLFSFLQVRYCPIKAQFSHTLPSRNLCPNPNYESSDKAGFSSGRLSSHQSRNGWNILAGKNWQKESGSGWSSIAVLGPHFIYIFWLVTNFLWLFGHILNEFWVKLRPQPIWKTLLVLFLAEQHWHRVKCWRRD